MNAINPEAKRYLNELYQRTEGNTGAQVSMFDVGAAMGFGDIDLLDSRGSHFSR